MAGPAEQRGGWLANAANAALAAVTCLVPSRAFLTRGKRASETKDRSALVIQRTWRGHRDRSRYLRLRRAAIRTQARWRAKRQRKRHLALRRSALIIQRKWRGHRDRSNYLALREAAILAQKHWRAAKARKVVWLRKLQKLEVDRISCQGLIELYEAELKRGRERLAVIDANITKHRAAREVGRQISQVERHISPVPDRVSAATELQIPRQPSGYYLHKSSEVLLIVGDGNFSFSRSVATQLKNGHNVIASTWEREEDLIKSYANAERNIISLVARGANVEYQVDATNMHKNRRLLSIVRGRSPDVIVFNMPYVRFKQSENFPPTHPRHRDLIRQFLRSARLMKGFRGRVHITQRIDCLGVDHLRVPEIAREEGFDAWCQWPVDDKKLTLLFPGYESKYGGGKNPDNDLPVDQALIYVFRARVRT